MRVSPVIDHIKADKAIGYISYGGAREYRALRAVPAALPAAFVIPLSRTTESLPRTGVMAQVSKISFAVVTILAEKRAGAVKGIDELDSIERALIDRLNGWHHPDGATPVFATGGQDISAELGAFAWATTFSFTSTTRKAISHG